MNPKVRAQLQELVTQGFFIENEERFIGYLETVGYHRLKPYLKHSKNNSQRTIELYLFDKKLRLLLLDTLEVVENAIKSIIINHLGEQFSTNIRYNNELIYKEEYIKERLSFIDKKVKDRKKEDNVIKVFFKYNGKETVVPDYLFFDKLTFGELIKVIRDMKSEYQKQISSYFGINNELFFDWILTLKYLRNLCSHYENIYNRNMTIKIRSNIIKEFIGNTDSCIAYLFLLSLFNQILIPTYNWNKKIIELINQFSLTGKEIGLENESTINISNIHNRSMLTNLLYQKHILKEKKKPPQGAGVRGLGGLSNGIIYKIYTKVKYFIKKIPAYLKSVFLRIDI